MPILIRHHDNNINLPGEVKGQAFGSPLARGLYPRASTAEVDPRAKPGAPAAVEITAFRPERIPDSPASYTALNAIFGFLYGSI